MTSLVLIPWANTDWHDCGRLASRTPLPLNAEGQAQAYAWGNLLAARELATLYSSKEQTSLETAALVVQRSEAKHKHVEGLEEIDFGLWEGLTEAELNSRFPKLFKKWIEDPPSVSVPDGEKFADAAARIESALKRIVAKHRNGAVGVVLAPTVLALKRCELEQAPINHLRKYSTAEPVWYELDSSGKRPPQTAGNAASTTKMEI
ncbi:MAG: histidine phosphatase family protein [Phycisphaerae bacterium]|nr:histidine phosphatase family protein [Phycisphaerae bacterium]